MNTTATAAFNALALFLLPISGFAAEALEVGSRRWLVTVAIVVFLSLIGWAASSLAQLARWTQGWPARWEILQGIFTSLLAGYLAYALAVSGGMGDMPCTIATAVAAWGGDRFLTPLLQRFINKGQ